MAWCPPELVNEVIDGTVRGPRANYIGEAGYPALDTVIFAVGADECLGGELCGAIMGDRLQRAVILSNLPVDLAVDGGGRGENDFPDRGPAHRLKHPERGEERIVEVDARVGVRASNVRVGGHVEHAIEAAGTDQLIEPLRVEDVAAYE